MRETSGPAPGDLTGQMRRVLTEVGERLNLPVEDAHLLRLHSNAIYALPHQGIVVRIATNPDAWTRVKASLQVTQWLAANAFPCTVPAHGYDQPVTIQGRTVSVWRFEETVPNPAPKASELGQLLSELHSQPKSPQDLPDLGDPFTSVTRALHANPGALSETDREWLAARITELRTQWESLHFPHPLGLIHGDAHPNNLMRRASGTVILGDWDSVCHGPREWDLAQIHYTHRRFGHPDTAGLDLLAHAYGWDIRNWDSLEDLIGVREIRGLSAFIRTATTKKTSRDELAHRLQTLRKRESTARWTRPTAT